MKTFKESTGETFKMLHQKKSVRPMAWNRKKLTESGPFQARCHVPKMACLSCISAHGQTRAPTPRFPKVPHFDVTARTMATDESCAGQEHSHGVNHALLEHLLLLMS